MAQTAGSPAVFVPDIRGCVRPPASAAGSGLTHADFPKLPLGGTQPKDRNKGAKRTNLALPRIKHPEFPRLRSPTPGVASDLRLRAAFFLFP